MGPVRFDQSCCVLGTKRGTSHYVGSTKDTRGPGHVTTSLNFQSQGLPCARSPLEAAVPGARSAAEEPRALRAVLVSCVREAGQ